MATNNSLSRTQRKLEKLELDHLRQLATDLHEQLEQAQISKEQAYQSAEFWQEYALHLQEAMADETYATHRAIGITKAGETMVVALQ